MPKRWLPSLFRLENSIRKSPLVPACLAAGAGILLADRSNWAGFAIVLALLLGLALFLQKRARSSAALIGASLFALCLYTALHSRTLAEIHAFPLASEISEGKPIEIQGSGWIASRVKRGERSVSGTLEITSLQIAEKTIPCQHRVPVWIQHTPQVLDYGSVVKFSGLLRPLESAQAPGGFDPSAFYFRQSGSLAQLEIREGDSFSVEQGKRGSRLLSFSQRLRDHLEEGLFYGIATPDEPYGRLIAAMSLGARENSPEDLEESFRLSGTMHIFAVSGLHVAVVAGLLLGTLLLCRVPRRYAVLIVIPLILFYALLTGLRPSAMRAAIMLSIVLASFAAKEQPRLLNSLALAGLVILCFNTQQLFLPGFQLSFAVLLFITLFAGPARRLFAAPWLSDPFIPKALLSPVRRFKDHAIRATAAALAVSVMAWLGSLGLLTWHFQSFSPIGIIANVFMVPLAGAVVTLAVSSLAFWVWGAKLAWLSIWINKLNVGVAIVLTAMAQFFGSLPGAHRNSGIFRDEQPSSKAMILDVMGEYGEGAILLSFPKAEAQADFQSDRSFWMIDPGGANTFQRQMLPTLRTRGVNRLDALVLTHGDSGHIRAAPKVLTQLPPSLLIESTAGNRAAVYPEIVDLAESRGIQRISLSSGQRLILGESTSLRVLAPPPEAWGNRADDQALVLKLRYGTWNLLFTSDSGFETEKRLLEMQTDLKSDVWIRGQHADSPSGLPSFAKAVQPRVVLSSSSPFPSSQKISDSLRKQLGKQGSTLLELDQTGVATIELLPDRLSVYSHSQGKTVFEERIETENAP